mmetsp:Transcript_28620/g.66311  ORF Transcript_28620/g.66311 Transcript_28620/m.66311 type:complete len:278 (+) Transcript_28620:1499-2332(+)
MSVGGACGGGGGGGGGGMLAPAEGGAGAEEELAAVAPVLPRFSSFAAVEVVWLRTLCAKYISITLSSIALLGEWPEASIFSRSSLVVSKSSALMHTSTSSSNVSDVTSMSKSCSCANKHRATLDPDAVEHNDPLKTICPSLFARSIATAVIDALRLVSPGRGSGGGGGTQSAFGRNVLTWSRRLNATKFTRLSISIFCSGSTSSSAFEGTRGVCASGSGAVPVAPSCTWMFGKSTMVFWASSCLKLAFSSLFFLRSRLLSRLSRSFSPFASLAVSCR